LIFHTWGRKEADGIREHGAGEIFVTKSEGEAGTGGKCFRRSFIICTTRM
jgi:hypothetical protein